MAQLVGRKSEVRSPAGATHILESPAQRLRGLVVGHLIAEAESIRTSVVGGRALYQQLVPVQFPSDRRDDPVGLGGVYSGSEDSNGFHGPTPVHPSPLRGRAASIPPAFQAE